MKKRLLAALLCAVMAVSMCACTNDGDGNNSENTQKEPATPPSISSLATIDDLKTVLKGDYEITDAKINDYFNSVLCAADAGLIKVTDRDTVQKGDIVQVDYTGYLDGKAFDNGAAKNQIMDVSNNCLFDEETGELGSTFIDKFSDGIIGAKIDEPVEHKVTFPKNYSSTDLAGKETTFKFNVDAIYVKATPNNVDDAYIAKHLSDQGYTTVAGLLSYVKEELVTNTVMGYLIEKSKVSIDEAYLNERLGEYEEFIVETAGGNTDIETLVKNAYGMELKTVEAYWLQYIKSQVTSEVVFAELVKAKSLALDEKELKEFVDDVIDKNDSFEKEDEVYAAIGYGNVEKGKTYILHEFAVKEYVISLYNASQAVTQ